jgi:hypothetical protein
MRTGSDMCVCMQVYDQFWQLLCAAHSLSQLAGCYRDRPEGGRENTFFEVPVGAQQFIVECCFKRFALADGTLWLGAHVGFE